MQQNPFALVSDSNMAPVQLWFQFGPIRHPIFSFGNFSETKMFHFASGEVTRLSEYRGTRHSHEGLLFKADPIISVFFHYDGKEAHPNIWSSGEKLAVLADSAEFAEQKH